MPGRSNQIQQAKKAYAERNTGSKYKLAKAFISEYKGKFGFVRNALSSAVKKCVEDFISSLCYAAGTLAL